MEKSTDTATAKLTVGVDLSAVSECECEHLRLCDHCLGIHQTNCRVFLSFVPTNAPLLAFPSLYIHDGAPPQVACLDLNVIIFVLC